MALKFKITKAAWAKLSPEFQAEYEEADDGKGYTLDISGLPEAEDAGELKRALDRVREELKEAEAERDTLQTAADEADKNKGKGDKDVERLTRRHDAKIAELKAENQTKIDGLKAVIVKSMKSAKSLAMATTISTAPELLQDKIDARMTVDFPEDGEPVLKFLDKDGKPAAADFTLEKLQAEIVANPAYKSIIVGSKAKGGGAPPAQTGPLPLNGVQSEKPTDLSTAPRQDFVEHIRQVRASQQQAG